MSSKKTYNCGSLADWLEGQDFSDFHDTLTKNGPDAAQTTLEETSTKRYVQYLALLSQLHSSPLDYCCLERLRIVQKMPHEYILCSWDDSKLVGTAQASLLFPAGLPTVHMSNVVIDVAYRGQGHGAFLMIMLRRRTRQRWQSQHGQLRYELTSRTERGTQGFYQRLGFTATPTTRYVR
jgi:ribosomal protein S18 acetylase RimI-like enzyme